MAASLPSLEKLDAFLEIIEDKRAWHLSRHPEMSPNAIVSDNGMQEINKKWMEEGNWMNCYKDKEYHGLCQSHRPRARQKAHQMRRRAFSAFLFQVIGHKLVLVAAIKQPVFSAAQPDADGSFSSAEQLAAILRTLMDVWEEENKTDEYRKRMPISQPCSEKRKGFKNTSHEARRVLGRCRKFNGAIMRNGQTWHDLNGAEKDLLDDFNSGKRQRVRDQCGEAFRGNRSMKSAGSAATRVSR